MVYITYYINVNIQKRRFEDMFQVEFYEKEDGDIPVEKFLNSLDIKMRNKILMILNVLQERGNQLREPYSKHLEDGIFEVRGKVGNDISRVLYFFYYNGKIIMTNGFIKKTQKTPKSEIELAKNIEKNTWKGLVNNMKTLNQYMDEQLKNDEFRKEWENSQPELDVIRAIVDARTSQNLTQKELSERTGINQADISKLENGTRNPSLNLLKRLADGMDMMLELKFVPKPKLK